MKVNAIECLHCGDIIFSRTLHDMRICSCGKISTDGGIDYFRFVTVADAAYRTHEQVEVDADAKDLYDDWNYGTNLFGKLVEFEIETT